VCAEPAASSRAITFSLPSTIPRPVSYTQFVAPVVTLIALELFPRQRNRSLRLLMLFQVVPYWYLWASLGWPNRRPQPDVRDSMARALPRLHKHATEKCCSGKRQQFARYPPQDPPWLTVCNPR